MNNWKKWVIEAREVLLVKKCITSRVFDYKKLKDLVWWYPVPEVIEEYKDFYNYLISTIRFSRWLTDERTASQQLNEFNTQLIARCTHDKVNRPEIFFAALQETIEQYDAKKSAWSTWKIWTFLFATSRDSFINTFTKKINEYNNKFKIINTPRTSTAEIARLETEIKNSAM